MKFMTNLALDSLGDLLIKEMIEKQAEMLIQEMMWLIVLASIPLLIFAVAYCFFGIKIYRILLVISGALLGITVGAVLLAIADGGAVGVIIGAILFGAAGGILSWYAYKVFLFIQTFLSAFSITTIALLLLTNNMAVSMVLGIIAGMALGILVCIYAKTLIMITTAYNGAGMIASILSLFFVTSGLYSFINFVLLIGLTVGGYFVQNKLYGSVIESNDKEKNIAGVRKYKLVGIEGMYKGFEFDIDNAIILGRDVENCNVIFPDTCAGVSRIQCQVMVDKKLRALTIVDKFSSYGTSLNGTKLEINKVTPIKKGDVIMFGENNVFKIEY